MCDVYLKGTDFVFHANVCLKKVQYRNKTVAKHAAKQVKKAGGPWLRPYECPVCAKYHLLNISKHKKRLIRNNENNY